MSKFINYAQPLFAAAFLVFMFAAWTFSAPALAMADTCTGIAQGSGFNIVCGGDCETEPDNHCQAHKGRDADGEYKYCACDAGDEPACCHLIVRDGGTMDTTGVCLTSLKCAKEDALKCELRGGEVNCYKPRKPPVTGGGTTTGGGKSGGQI